MAYQFTQTGAEIQAILNSVSSIFPNQGAPAGSDLNNAIDTGIYYADGTVTNRPGSGGGIAIVFRYSASNGMMFFVVNASTTRLYYRYYQGSNNGWTAWRHVTDEAV